MNLLDFDLNLLTTFDAIYRHNSLSAAANELTLTQPAVSAALKRMRDLFGNPLFVRTSRGMRPTPYADDMAPKIAKALAIIREVDQPTMFDPATSEVHFRIYINDIGAIVVMPKVIEFMQREAPKTKLTILDLRPDEVVNALDRGEIDLAIGYFLGMPNWAHQQNLRNTKYVCAVRKNHSTIGDSLSLDQFIECKHAKYESNGSLHSAVEQTLAQLNLAREVSLIVPRFSALPFLIAESDLIVTMPEDLLVSFSKFIDIKIFEPPLPLADFQIKQYWHERLHADAAFKWLRNAVRDITASV